MLGSDCGYLTLVVELTLSELCSQLLNFDEILEPCLPTAEAEELLVGGAFRPAAVVALPMLHAVA